MPSIAYIAVHPSGPSVTVEVQERLLGMRSFRYSIRTWRTCSQDLAEVFLMAWRDWDSKLTWGVNPDDVLPPRGWQWALAPFDDSGSFEAYCKSRMGSGTLRSSIG